VEKTSARRCCRGGLAAATAASSFSVSTASVPLAAGLLAAATVAVVGEARVDVDSTYGAVTVDGQPAVDALRVEQVHARQAPHVLVVAELCKANQSGKALEVNRRTVLGKHQCSTALHVICFTGK
jgi:hypothetical protein